MNTADDILPGIDGAAGDAHLRIDRLNEQAWEICESDPEAAVERAEITARLSGEGPGYPRGLGWSRLVSGHCAMQRGEHVAAQENLSEALTLLSGCGDRSGEAVASNELGCGEYRLGDYSRALELHLASLGINREIGDQRNEASVLLNIGNVHDALGEYPQALERFEASLDICREIGNQTGEAKALTSIGNVHHRQGEYPRALERFEESLRINREIGNRSGQASALGNIGSLHYVLGEYPQALRQYEASIRLTRETGDRCSEARTLSNIGIVHYALGEYTEALERYRTSLDIAREIGDRGGEARTLGNQGNVHHILGEYPEALQQHQASLRIKQEIGDRLGEASALGNIGLVHHALGEYPEALDHHQACLAIHREIGNPDGESLALANMGEVYYLLEAYPQALKHLKASLEISRQIGDRAGEAESMIGIARALSALGDFAAALDDLKAAAEIARDIGSRTTLAQASLALGRTHAAMKAPEQAVAVLNAALALAVELGEPALELEATELLAGQYEQLDDSRRALGHLHRHLEIQKEVLGRETRQTVRNLQTTWQMEMARKEAEIERLRNVELKQAFERLEQAHAELKGAQSQLVQSEKMASLGQLVAGVAHEINNPINFVTSSLGPLRRDIEWIEQAVSRYRDIGWKEPSLRGEIEEADGELELDEIGEEIGMLLGSIERGAARTTEIVAGLRNFSRLDENDRKNVDIHEGLESALTLLSSRLERIDLRREYDALPDVGCNPGEINQVFMNILGNAILAIDAEGSITVRTILRESDVVVEIADSGCGMTLEVQAKIFEPFFTTRDVGEGKGLGLSIAWGIVEKHGGTIEVASAPGEGSIFTIALPLDGSGE